MSHRAHFITSRHTSAPSPISSSVLGILRLWAVLLFTAQLLFTSPVAADTVQALQQALQQTREQLNQGQTASAITALKTLRKKHPAAPEVPLLLGVALARNGEFKQSDKIFNALIKKHPNLVQAYNNLAASQAAQGHLEKARKTLTIAIKRTPKYPVAHENLADIYAHLAESEYTAAARLQGENARLERKLTGIRAFIRPSSKKATKSSNPLPQAQPPSPSACTRIGPFIKSSHVESFKDQLEQAKIAYREQSHANNESIFSVYLAAKDEASPQQRLKQLSNLGIRDLAIINKGKHKGGIAMGVYRNPRSVQRRLRSLRAQGLDPQTETRTKQRKRPWLHLQASNKFTQMQKDLLKKLHKKSLKSHPASCP